MKRNAALRHLSIDHHHGLALARKAKSTAEASQDDSGLETIWAELESHVHAVLKPHFEIEETILATALGALNDPQINLLIERLYQEHTQILDLLSCNHPRSARHLKQVGELLTRHIRFEERVLFEIAQERLDSQALEVIAKACKH
ncbi:MAG: hemerythrin domain-containing protein [Nitrosomonas sp.]|nr:hemerythrin domain-containing protein [Nitrosomonas sp.]